MAMKFRLFATTYSARFHEGEGDNFPRLTSEKSQILKSQIVAKKGPKFEHFANFLS